MEIFLLTHSRETVKSSNTGRIILSCLPHTSHRIIWRRAQPDSHLVDEIKQGGVCLVYPVKGQSSEENFSLYRACIVLDGTWQEAQKMYNRSPYLSALPKISIFNANKSTFRLRRNQLENGLSTVETVAHILDKTGQIKTSEKLMQQFEAYQTEWLRGR